MVSPFHLFTFSPFHLFTFSPFHLFTFSPFHLFTFSPFHLFTFSPFHLAFPVKDIESTRTFYTKIIGCSVGREAERWIDFNFFGHQISVHLTDIVEDIPTNLVDGRSIPARHFGLVLEWNAWHQLVEQLNKKEIIYLIKPAIRFEGEVGEQATCFITDPSGNALEFKSFKDREQLFTRD